MFASPIDEARVLVMRGEYDGAIQTLSEFLNSEFYHDEALFMLGACLQAKGMNGLSAVLSSVAIDARATRKKPFPEALMNLGAAYKAVHKNEMAERIWLDALKQETYPRERSKIFCNLASLYVNEGQPEKAIEFCEKALGEDPNNHGAHANRGMAYLEMGRWKEGWEGWKHTYDTGDRIKRTYGKIPEWDGSPGKTLIVWGDQGIGDEIFFGSALPDLQRISKRLILDCHPRLPHLFERSFPEIEVHGTRKDMGDLPWLEKCDADASVGLSDLFAYFRNSDADWGDGQSYLTPDYRYGDDQDRSRLRIGLSWTGGTKRTRTDLRSVSLDALEPILKARPDAQWFSLQYTPNAARDVCDLEEKTGIRVSHYPGWVECYDYDRTAAFVASLDLVITVGTTIAHCAGALGVPVWILVPSRPSWRYMVRGERLPWYGSSKLYRQEQDGDWSGPINRIAQALADFG